MRREESARYGQQVWSGLHVITPPMQSMRALAGLPCTQLPGPSGEQGQPSALGVALQSGGTLPSGGQHGPSRNGPDQYPLQHIMFGPHM